MFVRKWVFREIEKEDKLIKKGDSDESPPCKGYEDRLTILQSPCQNETSLNAVFIPGAHLFFFLWHIMQVIGIQDVRTPKKF